MKWGVVSPLAFSVFLAISLQGQTQKTFDNVDDSNSDWGSCTDCAGGQNLADIFWMVPFQTSPSRDGNSTQFYVSASKPYADVLFWRKLGPVDSATHFTWNFRVYLDQASLGAQALEYDAFQYVGGREYMFGSECAYSTGHWDVWNAKAVTWVHTSLPCKPFKPNTWHHIVWQVHRTADGNMHFDSLTIDGVQHAINMTEPSGPLPSGWTDNLGVQWQMDTAGAPLTMNEWIDNVSLTVR